MCQLWTFVVNTFSPILYATASNAFVKVHNMYPLNLCRMYEKVRFLCNMLNYYVRLALFNARI
jgi:hypothetical protein